MVVERAFGLLEIHHRDKGQVLLRRARRCSTTSSSTRADRVQPRVVSDQVIRAVEPYHAQVINKMRYGDMLLAGESLLILETEPAGYIAFAANEALKAARVKLIDATAVRRVRPALPLRPRGADRRRARRGAQGLGTVKGAPVSADTSDGRVEPGAEDRLRTAPAASSAPSSSTRQQAQAALHLVRRSPASARPSGC